MNKLDKKAENKKLVADEQQELLKKVLGLSNINKKLVEYSANLYLLGDLYRKGGKKTKTRFLGWNDPQEIPYNPVADAFKASSSLAIYQRDLVQEKQLMYEYDFNAAYASIARTYSLPSNTFLKTKLDTDKVLGRISTYNAVMQKGKIDKKGRKTKLPYRDLSTFAFVKCYIEATAKPETYTEQGSMLSFWGKVISKTIEVTEIELKMIFDYYNVTAFEVIDTNVFRCRDDMFDEYFERLDKLLEYPEFVKTHKVMRNKLVGTLAIYEADNFIKSTFNMPFFNRALTSMIFAVFRDVMIRYEQKYCRSEYGLLFIKTDALYFRHEVPEFEDLVDKGVVKKIPHIISADDVKLSKNTRTLH